MSRQKLAPELLLTLHDFEQEGRAGLVQHMQTLGIVASEDSPKPPRIIVTLQCDASANFEHLEEQGIHVNQSAGRIRTAILPMEKVDVLANEPAVHRVEPSRQLNSLMDAASAKLNLADFRQSTHLTGQGTIVGIIDTGIDSKHPAFAGRILRIWDQTLSGPGVTEAPYGLEVTGPMLTASRDTNGHGTHVAGTAAGNDSVFGGIAPQAELVVVKTDLQNAHIIDAVHYIFRVAQELGRPAVINMSFGSHGDAHDGSDDLSLLIDDLSGPGRVVCCAAGNEGGDNIHAQATLLQNEERVIHFHVPQAPPNNAIVYKAWLNGWYSGEDVVEVAVQSPSGFQTPFQSLLNETSVLEDSLPDGDVRVVTPKPMAINGANHFLIEIRRISGHGVWGLKLRAVSVHSGRVDVWTIDNNQHVDVTFQDHIDDGMKIGSPAAAASAVTVGSYTTKTQWVDIGGESREVSSRLNDVSNFSSPGPLRNGQQKPDICAPGEFIVSALSSYAVMDRRLQISPQWIALPGTSMATPVVTGLVALLLEQEPTLTPQEIKTRLHSCSAIPGQPAGAFDPKWGYGLVNTLNLGTSAQMPETKQTQPQPSVAQPAPRELIVITKAEAGLRIRGQRVSSTVDTDVTDIATLLAANNVTLEPLFGVSEERLRFEMAVLAAIGSSDVPDLSRFYMVHAPDAQLDEVAAMLRSQPQIEAAYLKPQAEPAHAVIELDEGMNDMTPLTVDAPLATPDFTARQGYLGAAPAGIDARYAWNLPGGRGAGVNIIDIEGAWNFMHEDLLRNQGGVIAGMPTTDLNWRNHGTAVAGEISGDLNSFGISGICPDAQLRAVSIFSTVGSANAIYKAANALNAGDILLIELHRPGPEATGSGQQGFIAIEWWPDDFAALRYATSRGIIVVEAAGNGGVNFDSPIYDTPAEGFPSSWKNPLNPANGGSGAVIVGAGAPPSGTHGRDHGPDRSRLGFSNYGQRVDCQGWGREVTTTGYGDLQGGSDEDQWYTDQFSGTSSASPIVVGALGCVQGVLRARGLALLTPERARTLLRTTGSAQQAAPSRPTTQRIGNRPDLRQLLQQAS